MRPVDDYRVRETLVHGGCELEPGTRFPQPAPLPTDVPEVNAIDATFIYGGRVWCVKGAVGLTLEAQLVHDARDPVDDLVARGLLCPPGGCDDAACGALHGGEDA